MKIKLIMENMKKEVIEMVNPFQLVSDYARSLPAAVTAAKIAPIIIGRAIPGTSAAAKVAANAALNWYLAPAKLVSTTAVKTVFGKSAVKILPFLGKFAIPAIVVAGTTVAAVKITKAIKNK